MRLLPLLALLLLAGCASVDERWAESEFSGISYPSLYGVVLITIDNQGFTVRDRDPQSGEIHSEWVYGQSQSVVRGPARQRVHAVIEPLDDEGWFRVRVRVEQQVVRKGGMLATNVRENENWESFEDSFDEAEILMARVAALLDAHRSRAAVP